MHSSNSRLSLLAMALAVLITPGLCASTETPVYNFTGHQDGADPGSTLVFDSSGKAYGTTYSGGTSGCGTVYILFPGAGGQWQQTVLHSFNCSDEGKNPVGGVIFDGQGNLYGTTRGGGSAGLCSGDGCGVVYKLTHSGGSWTETVLYSFGDNPDAATPVCPLVFDRAGNLLGTTLNGGAFAAGAVFELSPSNGQWTERIVHDFTGGNDGALGSLGALLPDRTGNFYGVTQYGGAHQAGTVFKLAPGAGGAYSFSSLYAFQGQPDAATPEGGLIADLHGNLYGTSAYGGTNNMGTVFRVSPAPGIGGWHGAVLYSFTGLSDGGEPASTLVFGANGKLYGTTTEGGTPGCECGVILSLTPTGINRWSESVLHSFGIIPDGVYPTSGLTLNSAGQYMGTTSTGGTHNAGIVYEMTP